MKDLVHLIFAALFFVFGIVQWNDPDPYLWITMYFYVGICILLSAFTQKAFYPLIIGMILFLTVLINYIPDVNQWVKDGMPSIIGSMKAESQYIELVREFFGLFISLVALIYYFVKVKKRS